MTGGAPVAIRPARPDDLAALLRLEEVVFPGDRLDRRGFRHAIGSPTIVSLVAERGGLLAGYALVETRRNTKVARLSSIAVDPAVSGGGIGRRLLATCEHEAAARGCRRMRLEVRADNGRAATLYERAGYRLVGREDEYYEDGEAANRFEKALVPSGTGAGGTGSGPARSTGTEQRGGR